MPSDGSGRISIAAEETDEWPHRAGEPPRASLRRLFERHRHELFRFLRRRLSNEQDAEEALQETFLRASRHHPAGKLDGHARAYLFTTAANLVVDVRRRAAVRAAARTAPLEAAEDLAAPDDVEDTIHWRRNIDFLLESLGELSPMTQKIFLLYHTRRLSYKEIAGMLDLTTRTVERHMAAALAHCKKRLGSRL